MIVPLFLVGLCFFMSSLLLLHHLQIISNSVDPKSPLEMLFERTSRENDKLLRNDRVLKRHKNIKKMDGKYPEVSEKLKQSDYPLARLECEQYGGPSAEAAKEMVYWEDIPPDRRFISPFKIKGETQYLTFDPDGCGWNNMRMAMETVMTLAFSMGRTLVLPPSRPIKHIHNLDGLNTTNRQSAMSFTDFFPLEDVAKKNPGLEIITMDEFLKREGLSGNIRDRYGKIRFPPRNRTQFDGTDDSISEIIPLLLGNITDDYEWPDNIAGLTLWLSQVLRTVDWNPEECLAAFPASSDASDLRTMSTLQATIEGSGGFPNYQSYIDRPQPVDAPTTERLKEHWANRKRLCIYEKELQSVPILHFPHPTWLVSQRLLVHFYAFAFFQDWRQDLWMKRFIRDHIRYKDEIQCAAARVVQALRNRSRRGGDPEGQFESFHIRRGDFAQQFKVAFVSADSIYDISKSELQSNATVYVATDERNRSYFNPLIEHYDVVFLDDFTDQLEGIDTSFYGMVDQLVASRGRAFFGCWYSTFTGYINRLRGYHANRAKSPGYENGIIPSWYYATEGHRNDMRHFHPLFQTFYSREFPTSWRFIDQGIKDSTKHAK